MDWKAFMEETEGRVGTLQKDTPGMFEGFARMSIAAKRDGALDETTKELIALAIGVSTRCDSCIGYHTRALARLGCPRDRLCEALEMVGYMGGGPSIAYAGRALEAFDQFSA